VHAPLPLPAIGPCEPAADGASRCMPPGTGHALSPMPSGPYGGPSWPSELVVRVARPGRPSESARGCPEPVKPMLLTDAGACARLGVLIADDSSCDSDRLPGLLVTPVGPGEGRQEWNGPAGMGGMRATRLCATPVIKVIITRPRSRKHGTSDVQMMHGSNSIHACLRRVRARARALGRGAALFGGDAAAGAVRACHTDSDSDCAAVRAGPLPDPRCAARRVRWTRARTSGAGARRTREARGRGPRARGRGERWARVQMAGPAIILQRLKEIARESNFPIIVVGAINVAKCR
jgi:hypothetical protein